MSHHLPDPRIIKAIQKHHILTLATSANNVPHCCTCFYAYNPTENLFIIISESETRHISEATKNPVIAGNIALETKIIGKIRGIQFSGTIEPVTEKTQDYYRKEYIRKFTYVKHFIGNTPFWILRPNFLKLTDNKLGFGKKIIWLQTTDVV